MATKITRNVLGGYLTCKHKGWLQLEGKKGQESDYEAMVTDRWQELRTRAMAELLAHQGQGEMWQGTILTTELLAKGPSVIVDATLGEL